MRRFVLAAFTAMLLQYPSTAQTQLADLSSAVVSNSADNSLPDDPSGPNDNTSGSGVVKPAVPDYAPMTTSERARKYIVGAFGPGAIVRAAAGAGIAQWEMTPKEWRVGPEAYGDRFGNAMATHAIREALEFGGSLALKEDNRYFRSTESGFLKRSKHAVVSAFTARNEAGAQHLAYSRVIAVAGSSFISRFWQPASTDSAGDAAVSFGITMAADIGWNFFREFRPHRSVKQAKAR
jgi:hypothetical protein